MFNRIASADDFGLGPYLRALHFGFSRKGHTANVEPYRIGQVHFVGACRSVAQVSELFVDPVLGDFAGHGQITANHPSIRPQPAVYGS